MLKIIMTINIADTEMLLGFAKEMASLGYRYAAHPLNLVTDSDSIAFFRTAMGAEDHCLIGPNDTDYFKSMPIDSLIDGLKMVMQSGMDTCGNGTLDLASFVRSESEKRELTENNLNGNIMNQKNLEFLENQIKYTGFGESLQIELKKKMEKGEKEFTLSHDARFDTARLLSELSFKKSDQSDLYFFNSYKAILQKEGAPHALEQIFYIGSENNFTVKEAFNLLEGRSVNKDLVSRDGEIYNCWVKLDFTDGETNGNFKMHHYHQNYGYNLEAALEKHAIKELQTPEAKESLMNSLKKGNVQAVTFIVGGEEKRQFVEANPQFKTIRVYDSSMQRINGRESQNQKQQDPQQNAVSSSKSQKKGADGESKGEDVSEEQQEKKAKKKSQSI